MHTIRTRLAVVVVAVVAVTAVTGGWAPMDARASDTWTTTKTEPYDMGDLGPVPNLPGHLMLGTCHSGTVCFGSTVGDTFTVTVKDQSGREVGGVIAIRGKSGGLYRPFCGTSKPLPAVAGDLSVHLDAPGDVSGAHWYGGPGCAEIRPTGETTGATAGATSGWVHVMFTEQG